MSSTLQTLIVIIVVTAAVASIIRRAVRVIRNEQCAGSCGSACSKQQATGDAASLPLVSLNVSPGNSSSSTLAK